MARSAVLLLFSWIVAEEKLRWLLLARPAWTRWYETADSFEEARRLQFTTDAANFEKLFGEKKNRLGDGFTFWLWTGDNLQETSSVNGACGSADPRPPSTCVLKPYDEGLIGDRVLTAPVMTEVLRAMALAWDPEWGVATSEAHRDSVTEKAKPGTPVRIEPVEDKGT